MSINIGTVSLRASLIAITAVITLGSAVLAGLNSLEAWRDLRTAQLMQSNNETADLFLASAGAWAAERGITNAALNAAQSADVQTRARILDLRERADSAFAEAVERVRDGREFGAKDALLSQAQRDYDALTSMRREVDQAISQSRGERNARVVDQWEATTTRAIMTSQELRLTSQSISETALARAQMLQDVKNAVWIMSEFAGRERAAIAGYIAEGQAIGPDDLSLLAGMRGRMEQAWMAVQAYAAQDFAAPEILRQVATVESVLFGTFEPHRDAVYAAGASDGAYPLTTGEWIEEATKAIDSLLELSDQVSSVAEAYSLAAAAQEQRAFYINAAVLLGALAIGALSFWIVIQRVTMPINRLIQVMTRLARGDKSIAIPSADRQDEIGSMARAVQVFKDNALETERLRAQQEEAERRAETEKRQEMEALADRFEGDVGEVIETLSRASQDLNATAEQMQSIAAQTSERSAAVAAASNQASSNVQTVAAATEELSKSIAEIDQQVSTLATMAHSAVENADRANTQVRGLAEAVEKIGEVVDLVQDIAEQTNLLALNATIEAARAGEAGKGFAVVANEVKSLASQTTKATQEIADRIARVQGETQEAVGGIEKIGDAIRQIDEIAASIASAVEEQEAATEEIARNIQEAAAGTESVDNNIGSLRQVASETGAAAEQVVQAVTDLSAKAGLLSQRVEGFLSQVRAA